LCISLDNGGMNFFTRCRVLATDMLTRILELKIEINNLAVFRDDVVQLLGWCWEELANHDVGNDRRGIADLQV
jgi:hypothetical protein